MLPKIEKVKALPEYKLLVKLVDGKQIIYDVQEDIDTIEAFAPLKTTYKLFEQVQVDSSRTCIYWNDEIDLASDTIVEYGKLI